MAEQTVLAWVNELKEFHDRKQDFVETCAAALVQAGFDSPKDLVGLAVPATDTSTFELKL